MAGVLTRNTIRTFALVCVAATSIFVMIMGVWVMFLLADKSWCDRAVGATKYAHGRPDAALNGCFALMGQQIGGIMSLGMIFAGVVALCLLVLMVVVVAGGKISFKASRDGAEGSIGSDTGGELLHAGDSVKLEKEE